MKNLKPVKMIIICRECEVTIAEQSGPQDKKVIAIDICLDCERKAYEKIKL